MAPAKLLRGVIPAALFALSDAYNCVAPTSATTGYDTTACTGVSATCSTNNGVFSLSGCVLANKCQLPSTVPTGYDAANCAATSVDRKTVRQCTMACAANYAGTPTVACTSTNGVFSFGGCSRTCTPPSTAGYDFSGCQGAKTTGQCSVTCATGYQGTALDACATAGGTFSVSGCTAKPTCTLPSSATMYDTTSCAATSSSTLNVDQCTVTCATNYAGTATKTCGGNAFSFNGCSYACTLPSTTTGYDVSGCSGSKSTSQCSLSCASGYYGNPSKTCSAAGGTFALSGCSALPTCTTPTTIPAGYTATACDTSSAAKNIQQCSMSCDTSNHYEGTATATCSTNGGTFTFSGCTAKKVCHLFSSTTGYVTTNCAATTSARLREDQCSVTCATGYAGTATDGCIVNTGAFTFSGCARACTLPSTTTGYDVTNCQGTKNSAQCTVSCASGYIGSPSDTCDTAAGTHAFSGCSVAPQCELPTSTTGYTTTGCAATTANKLYGSQCTVLCDTSAMYLMNTISSGSCGVTCASGYTGTASPSCPSSGAAFTFTGCTSGSVAGGAVRAESLLGFLSAVLFFGRYLVGSA